MGRRSGSGGSIVERSRTFVAVVAVVAAAVVAAAVVAAFLSWNIYSVFSFLAGIFFVVVLAFVLVRDGKLTTHR